MKNPTLDQAIATVNAISTDPGVAPHNFGMPEVLALTNAKATIAVAHELREANRLAEAAAFRQTQANLLAYATLLHTAGEPVPDGLMGLIKEAITADPSYDAAASRDAA